MKRIPSGNRAQPRPVSTPQNPSGSAGSGLPHRFRLAIWRERGLAPADLSPAAVAAAHLRITGRPATRDPSKRSNRVYSADELRAALVELTSRPPRPAPPPPQALDPLPLIWAAALQRLELPSSRMLLAQQGQLIALRERGPLLVALIAAAPSWLPLIQARRDTVAQALSDTLARPVALQLLEVEL